LMLWKTQNKVTDLESIEKFSETATLLW
jgi:hypothetical protein